MRQMIASFRVAPNQAADMLVRAYVREWGGGANVSPCSQPTSCEPKLALPGWALRFRADRSRLDKRGACCDTDPPSTPIVFGRTVLISITQLSVERCP